MAGILEKRRSLHKNLVSTQEQNELLESQLSQFQALANVGLASCMIAHEMNNIITPLANYAQLALNNPTDVNLTQKALQKTALNSSRAAKILDSMLAIVNGNGQEKQTCRLKDMIDEIFTCLCRDFAKDKIKVDIRIDPDFTIYAVPIQIQQVLMNLILNAREAMLPAGGTLEINSQASDGECIVSIADTGPGISKENISRVFDPFFTTKKRDSSPAGGAGLGLAFCKQIIDAHNGRISVTSQTGSGTVFKIALPKQI